MNAFRSLSLVLVGAALLAAGCPKNVPAPDDAIRSPQKLRDAVEARTESFENARFKEVVLDYFGKKERVKVRQLILVERPDKVRVQTRVPGSHEILNLLVTDGETFALHRRRSNEFVTGPPTRSNINRLLPLDLSARDIVRVMLGGAPWDRFASEPGTPTLEWDGEEGMYEYAVETEKGGRLAMYVSHEPFRVESVVERDADGALAYRYTTDDWIEAGDGTLPGWRRFVWPARDLDFSLEVDEIEVDVELPDSLFRLEPPPGSTIKRVGPGGSNASGSP